MLMKSVLIHMNNSLHGDTDVSYASFVRKDEWINQHMKL